MEIEEGEIYTSYQAGSKAKVIRVDDDIVTYEITYHPTTDRFIGRRNNINKEEFIEKTLRFNIDYDEQKRQLNI